MLCGTLQKRGSTHLHVEQFKGDDTLNVKKASGIELLLAIKEGKIPYSSIADTVPMRFTEVEIGSIKCVIKADSRHINPLGGVHGGFAATVLDSVTGCAIHTWKIVCACDQHLSYFTRRNYITRRSQVILQITLALAIQTTFV